TSTSRSAHASKTPRREHDRGALERRRVAQIEAHLETARSAFGADDHDAAIASCEQALLLDAENPLAIALLDQVNAAAEAKRAQQYLDEAQAKFQAGELTSAFELVEQALDLDEPSGKALELKAAIEEVQQQRKRERERR